MSNSLSHVREKYGVPAKRGLRVTTETREAGVITSGDGAHVRVRLDGQRHSAPWHPLSLDYGDGIGIAAREAWHNARIDTWNDRLNKRISVEEYRERMSVPLEARP